jgi:hypothetical protein
MRPIADARHQAVLHRIEMDIVEVPREILLVADRVLPKPSLPEPVLAFAIAFDRDSASHDLAGEVALDPPPSAGKVEVVRRQSEDCVEVVRQDHDSIDREGAFARGHADGGAKLLDVIDERGRTSILQRDCEEERPAWNEVSPVPDHPGRLAGIGRTL